MVAIGLVGITVTAFMAKESPFARYFLLEALAPERVLPPIGLGAACGQVDTRSFGAALLMFGLGILLGSAGQDWLLWALYKLPGGPIYLFLTGPISCLAIGVTLLPGARPLPWLLPIGSIVAGAMLSLAIFLNDPSLHEPAFILTPVLAAFWIVAAVALTVRAFWRGWVAIFGRILGSWLVAIGLLYGGASLLPVLKPPPPTVDTSRGSTRGAEINRTIPGRPEPEQPAFSPGGFERPPQP